MIPRSTAARYRGTTKSLDEIGRELGVTYVLEGTVQFEEVKDSAPRVRVSPELIRVSDTSSVWAHGYDAVMSSVFQVYSDVATEVAKSLAVALDDPERRALAVRPTANTEAYDLYLRAIDYINRGMSAEVFTNAVPMLERAVALDSTFALAWGELSETLALSHWLYISRTDETMAAPRRRPSGRWRCSQTCPRPTGPWATSIIASASTTRRWRSSRSRSSGGPMTSN